VHQVRKQNYILKNLVHGKNFIVKLMQTKYKILRLLK